MQETSEEEQLVVANVGEGVAIHGHLELALGAHGDPRQSRQLAQIDGIDRERKAAAISARRTQGKRNRKITSGHAYYDVKAPQRIP
jgi:hypothetical protein